MINPISCFADLVPDSDGTCSEVVDVPTGSDPDEDYHVEVVDYDVDYYFDKEEDEDDTVPF
jgi:hypothetical protein